MKKEILTTAIACAIGAMTMISCGGKSSANGEGQDSVPKYELQVLKPVDTEVTYKLPAILKGINEVEIYPQVDGRITGIFYENGYLVTKGQRLVTIESSQRQMQVNTLKAGVKSAEAVVSSARLKLDSQKKLYEKHIVSEFVYRTAQNEYETACAQLAQAKAQLSIAQTDLDRCTVTSPITGVVNGKNYNVGALVSPSMQLPLTVVSAQDVVRAQFSIPENVFAEVLESGNLVSTPEGYGTRDARKVNNMFSFTLLTSQGEKYRHQGRFHSMSGMVDSQTGTATCYVDFDNPEGILHSGNSATIVIPVQSKGVFVIPQSACKKLQDKYLIYKVGADGLAESVIINVYPADDGKSYIVSDSKLRSGDEILRTGVARVVDGTKLK